MDHGVETPEVRLQMGNVKKEKLFLKHIIVETMFSLKLQMMVLVLIKKMY